MVALPQVVDVDKQAGQSGNTVLIPEGKYPAVIINSEMKETSKGGQMIKFDFVITKGEYQNTEFTENANIVNSNPKAVDIGYQMIANIGKALNLKNVADTSELHNKPLVIEVKNKKSDDWVNDQGDTVEGKMRSEIKKFHPSTMATGAAPAAATQDEATTTPETTQEASTPAKNPFAAL